MAKRAEKPPGPGDEPKLESASEEVERQLANVDGANVRSMKGLNALLKDVATAEGVSTPQLLYDLLKNPLRARFLANYDRIIYQRKRRDEMGVPPPDSD